MGASAEAAQGKGSGPPDVKRDGFVTTTGCYPRLQGLLPDWTAPQRGNLRLCIETHMGRDTRIDTSIAVLVNIDLQCSNDFILAISGAAGQDHVLRDWHEKGILCITLWGLYGAVAIVEASVIITVAIDQLPVAGRLKSGGSCGIVIRVI